MDITWPGLGEDKGETSPHIPAGDYPVVVAKIEISAIKVDKPEEAKPMWAAQDGCLEFNVQFQVLPGESEEGFPLYKRYRIPFVKSADGSIEPNKVLFDEYDWLCKNMRAEVKALFIACDVDQTEDSFNIEQLTGEKCAVTVTEEEKVKGGKKLIGQKRNEIVNVFKLADLQRKVEDSWV